MVAVFALSMVFNSCEKDGRYAPNKKISKIVFTRSHKAGDLVVSSTQSEKWAWSGDLLSYIEYYNSDGDRTGTLWFRYDDDKRIKEAEDGRYDVKYDYDDGRLDEIEICYASSERMYQKMEFDYKGGKLASIDITTYNKNEGAPMSFNPLRFILSDDVAEVVMSRPATKGVEHLMLTWSGKNITEMASTSSDNYHVKWTYDDKINPFKGFLNMELDIDQTHSANNVIREEISKNGTVRVVDYNYEYNGKYPTKVKYKTESNTLIPGYTLTVDNVKEYQY